MFSSLIVPSSADVATESSRFKSIIKECSKPYKELNFRELVKKEDEFDLDKRIPIIVYGVRYGKDIAYTARFSVFDMVVGNICPCAFTLRDVLVHLINRVKVSSSESEDVSRDVIFYNKILDEDPEAIFKDELSEPYTITPETEVINIVF